MKAFLILLIFVSTLYFLACVFLYYKQESLIFFPEVLRKDFQFHFYTNFREINIDVKEGRLNALHFSAKNPKGVMLYLHGNAGSLRTWGVVSDILTKTGYDVFMYDYRTYGKSTGKLSEKNMYRDAQHVYDYLKTKWTEDQIIVYGRSLGTGFAAQLASKNNPQMLILETPYYSLRSMADHQLPLFPVSILLRYKVPTYRFIKKTKCPVLVFHGTHDELIPYEQSIKLKKHLKPTDSFVTIEGGTHNNLTEYDHFSWELNSFIKKYE